MSRRKKLLLKQKGIEKIIDPDFSAWKILVLVLSTGATGLELSEIREHLDISRSTLDRRIKELRDCDEFSVTVRNKHLYIVPQSDSFEIVPEDGDNSLTIDIKDLLRKPALRRLYFWEIKRGEVKEIANKAEVSKQMVSGCLKGDKRSARVEQIIAEHLGVKRSTLWD